jgi:fructose-bisphosphate aldolase class II
MSLMPFLNELIKARAGGYAAPCFDTVEMLGTEGMFIALEEKRAPALVALWSGILDRPQAKSIACYVRSMAEEATVPISLILDHGADFEHCIKAIALGFTDVMYDGSQLPLDENIANTRQVVRAAHAAGCGTEAELGHVGRGTEYDVFGGKRKGFTDAATVERFVAETGVDSLAVAIGTAHGLYKGDPMLDLELLAEIRRRVDIPLVLHGGTGLTEEQYRAAIAGGVSKINIFTDLAITAGKQMCAVAAGERPSYFSIGDAARKAFHDRCGYFIDLFGATGKG